MNKLKICYIGYYKCKHIGCKYMCNLDIFSYSYSRYRFTLSMSIYSKSVIEKHLFYMLMSV